MTRLPGSGGFPNLYISMVPGTDRAALRQDLEEQAAFIAGAVPPSVVSNLDLIDRVSYFLAGYLALLAVASTAHALTTGARRRRRELAILKAVGFVRAQARVAALSQAVTLVSPNLRREANAW